MTKSRNSGSLNKNSRSSSAQAEKKSFRGDKREASPRRHDTVVGKNVASNREPFSGAKGRRVSSFRGKVNKDAPRAQEGLSKRVPEEEKFHYYAVWKPYGVNTRIVKGSDSTNLGYYIQIPDVYPSCLLDNETEGLVILTDNPKLRYALGHVKCAERRLFLAQVEEVPCEEALLCLEKGVLLNGTQASPVAAQVIPEPILPSRPVPVRERLNVPTSWLELISTEGWSKQIRRVTASIGHPTLRLVLWAIGPVSLTGMMPGQCRQLRYEELSWIDQAIERAPQPKSRLGKIQFSQTRQHKTPQNGERQRSKTRWAVRTDATSAKEKTEKPKLKRKEGWAKPKVSDRRRMRKPKS